MEGNNILGTFCLIASHQQNIHTLKASLRAHTKGCSIVLKNGSETMAAKTRENQHYLLTKIEAVITVCVSD